MKRTCILGAIIFSWLPPANAQVDPKIADFCLNAKDFGGCVTTMQAEKNTDFCLKAKDFEGCIRTLGSSDLPPQRDSAPSQNTTNSSPQQETSTNKVRVAPPDPFFMKKIPLLRCWYVVRMVDISHLLGRQTTHTPAQQAHQELLTALQLMALPVAIAPAT